MVGSRGEGRPGGWMAKVYISSTIANLKQERRVVTDWLVAARHQVVHLHPPSATDRIWLERFSPLFSDHETCQISVRTPERSYRYVYPRDVDLERVAYFFDYHLESGVPEAAYRDVQKAVGSWCTAWRAEKRPSLT